MAAIGEGRRYIGQVARADAAVIRLSRRAARVGPTTERRIMAIPVAARIAYETLLAELGRGIEQYRQKRSYSNVSAICDAVRRFVHELHTVSTWRAELEHRATLIERACSDGSPWRRAADTAMALLANTLETDNPMETAFQDLGLSTPDRLRCEVRTGVSSSLQLKSVIEGIERAKRSNGLAADTQSALDDWRAQSVRILDSATREEADGCYWLHQVYRDLEEWRSEWPASQQGDWVGGCFLQPMLNATRLLMGWIEESPPAAKTEQNEGNGVNMGDNTPEPPDTDGAPPRLAQEENNLIPTDAQLALHVAILESIAAWRWLLGLERNPTGLQKAEWVKEVWFGLNRLHAAWCEFFKYESTELGSPSEDIGSQTKLDVGVARSTYHHATGEVVGLLLKSLEARLRPARWRWWPGLP